jgi:thiamine-monophosphate kinase
MNASDTDETPRRSPSEAAILAAISEVLGSPAPPFGIGDDAAVLPSDGPGLQTVVSVDAAVEGVHFTRDLLSLEDIGFRATMAAASDLAAMGARPTALLAALTAPRGTELATFRGLAEGQRQAAVELGVPFVGGNLARGPGLSITTTVLGTVSSEREAKPGPPPHHGAARGTRRGAAAGDVVAVLGPIGLAFAGFSWLDRLPSGTRRRVDYPEMDSCVSAFRRPRARLDAGQAARPLCSAMMDLSDGLAIDGARLAGASGVSLMLSAEAIVAAGGAALERAAARLGQSALSLALHGGEDYALLITAPASDALDQLLRDHEGHKLGTVQIASEGGPLQVFRRDGGAAELPTGFEHF